VSAQSRVAAGSTRAVLPCSLNALPAGSEVTRPHTMHACMQIQTTQWRAVSIRLRRAPALPVPPSTSATNHRHYLAGGEWMHGVACDAHGPAGEPTGDRSLETRADAMPPHRGHGTSTTASERGPATRTAHSLPDNNSTKD
jgi:hypothetical protein